MAVIQQKAAYVLFKMTSKRIALNAFWKNKYKHQYKFGETQVRRISSNMHTWNFLDRNVTLLSVHFQDFR